MYIVFFMDYYFIPASTIWYTKCIYFDLYMNYFKGPDEDREEESEMSITAMKEQREKQKKEAEVLRHADLAAQEKKMETLRKKEEDSGCSWGMGNYSHQIIKLAQLKRYWTQIKYMYMCI